MLLEDFWPPPPVVLPTDPYLMLRPDESYSVSFDPPLEEGFQLGAIWSPATQDTALTSALLQRLLFSIFDIFEHDSLPTI